jgi:hypothetical protein
MGEKMTACAAKNQKGRSSAAEYGSMKKWEHSLSLALLLMVWTLGVQRSEAQIQFDVASSATVTSSGTTLTWSHTVANQSNRMLIVGVQSEGTSGVQASSVTYGGVALTKVDQVEAYSSSYYQDVSQWYLIAPTVGTANIIVTWGSSISTGSAGAIGLYGVAQQAPEASASNFSNSGATTTNITTKTSGAWVVDVFGSGQTAGNLAPGSGQTQRYIQSSGSTTSGGGSTKSVATAGATSMTWTQTGINRSAQVVASFAPYGVAPLPIQLTSCAAYVVRDRDVEVDWQTASETNNYGFEIYRKRGGTNDWTRIAFVEGHGTTLAPHSYSYDDPSLAFGEYTYQIKQVDLDGKSQTFQEMQVTVGVVRDKLLLEQNYPNPFNPSTVIEFSVPMSGHATMTVYNVLGQEVTTLFDGNVEAGRINTAHFNAVNLPSGLYFYTLRTAGQVETKRMLLTK